MSFSFFCQSILGELATESKDLSATARMPLILFWAKVEEEDGNSVFLGLMKRDEAEDEESSLLSGLMKMEEEEVKESSLLLGLMKMEDDEEEQKETSVFSGVTAREEGRQSDLLCWEMVSDHLWAAKISSRPHHPKITRDQA